MALMSTSEFRPQRPALESKLRAALLAGSFSRFRKEQHRYPITAMSFAHGAVPIPIEEFLPKLHKSGPQPDRTAHVARYINRSLERGAYERGAHVQGGYVQAARTPVQVDSPASTEDTMRRSIDFDDASWTTQVTVTSRFKVTDNQAATILDSARPPEWQHAASDFFKSSQPVEYDSGTGRIEVHRENADRACYQLYEHVEWDWSETTEGGLANILTIRQATERSREQYGRCLESLSRGELLLEEGELDHVAAQAHRDRWPLVEYSFELFRSLRSKFVSNWEMGGLDVDEGEYVALWSPVTERLYIRTSKRLRYSARAGGIEGFSSMLNLLAPATVGMLLENLAYQGILEFLNPDD
jgi:hypothetical protein